MSECAGLDYRGKVMLAPMVRVGTLPIRLLSLQYGADLVYTEEIIDFRMLRTKRVENDILQTVDYISADGTITFRTCQRERGKVIFQMGTADAARALKVAKMVEKDVAAIDINMGCPKEFSIKGGMGAALLQQPKKIKEILTTLVQGLSIPVSCKIRVLPTVEETLQLVHLIASTGVSALAIHGRMKEERPRHPNRNNLIRVVAEAINIPVIANGGSKEVKCYEDIQRFREDCGASSVMLARAAQWNPSIFRSEGMYTSQHIIKDYLKYAAEYETPVPTMKYVMQQLMHEELESPDGQALLAAGIHADIFQIWGMIEYLEDVRRGHQVRQQELMEHQPDGGLPCHELDDGTKCTLMAFKYMKKEYPADRTPKMILYEWCVKEGLPNPEYVWDRDISDHTFLTRVTVRGHAYGSSIRDKNKKFSQQSAAVVCLRALGIDDLNRTIPSIVTENRKSISAKCERHCKNIEERNSTIESHQLLGSHDDSGQQSSESLSSASIPVRISVVNVDDSQNSKPIYQPCKISTCATVNNDATHNPCVGTTAESVTAEECSVQDKSMLPGECSVSGMACVGTTAELVTAEECSELVTAKECSVQDKSMLPGECSVSGMVSAVKQGDTNSTSDSPSSKSRFGIQQDENNKVCTSTTNSQLGLPGVEGLYMDKHTDKRSLSPPESGDLGKKIKATSSNHAKTIDLHHSDR